jgi:ABC-2 type transport system permease protein
MLIQSIIAALKTHLPFSSLVVVSNIKRSMALKFTFSISLILTIIKQLLFLVSWKFFFVHYKLVNGWHFEHMLLMYGLVCFAIGFIEVFFIGLKDIPKMVETAHLDTYILQPKNIIYNIALSRSDPSALGEVITGIILICYSGFFSSHFLFVIIALFSSAIFMFALHLYIACLAFYMNNSHEFVRELSLNVVIISTQPNSAYYGILKMFTFTLLPVAFLSFLPIEFFRTDCITYLVFSIVGTFVFFAIACWLFHTGLKRYESGNMSFFRT